MIDSLIRQAAQADFRYTSVEVVVYDTVRCWRRDSTRGPSTNPGLSSRNSVFRCWVATML